jgi:hypothetical protein
MPTSDAHHPNPRAVDSEPGRRHRDYFVFGEERHGFVGINYCPFCGRVLSRGLWNLEKKKQGDRRAP